MEYIVNSCPIILAKGPRSGHAKVAWELCKKSYHSSRKEWFYGIRPYAVAARKLGHLSIPVPLMASGAAQHDLPAAKQIIEDHASLKLGKRYANKAYMDAVWAQSLKRGHALALRTPRKRQCPDLRRLVLCICQKLYQ